VILKQPYYLIKIKAPERNNKALLCLHGLNQNPNSLILLLEEFAQLGFSPYLLSLPGHISGSLNQEINKKKYIENYLLSYKYLKEKYGDDINCIGYSMGGLIIVSCLDIITYKKVVLIAPALTPKKYTFLINLMLPFFCKIKSIRFYDWEVEKKYRFHVNGVPREIYQTYFSIYKEFESKKKEYLRETTALVLCHPHDELIDYKKLWQWIAKYTNWQKEIIDNKEAKFNKFNHLCIDKETLGNHSFKVIIKKINDFLIS
jgi:esterase/lipase